MEDKKDGWADAATPTTLDETAGNWMSKLERLRISVCQSPGELAPEARVVKVELSGKGGRKLGFLELYKAPGEGGKPRFLVKTEHTRWYAEVIASAAEQVEEDLGSVYKRSSARGGGGLLDPQQPLGLAEQRSGPLRVVARRRGIAREQLNSSSARRRFGSATFPSSRACSGCAASCFSPSLLSAASMRWGMLASALGTPSAWQPRPQRARSIWKPCLCRAPPRRRDSPRSPWGRPRGRRARRARTAAWWWPRGTRCTRGSRWRCRLAGGRARKRARSRCSPCGAWQAAHPMPS